MLPESIADGGATRRSFIKGVAAAGASTAAATALETAGIADLVSESAAATGATGRFAEFDALGASSADQLEVPPGYRADVLISWGDAFSNRDGTKLAYGFNNDFLAFFSLKGSDDEGLLFVNHEYPSPFFLHGTTDPMAKTAEQIRLEQDAVGNSVLHVRRDRSGVWKVVSPSRYNRRITGASPEAAITGPLRGYNADGSIAGQPIIGDSARGSLANCSGGITPWGTALSCEENFQEYPLTTTGLSYGWTNPAALAADPRNAEYDNAKYARYGWVVETDPYDPSWTPRKHTALGRFRHENAAFRARPGTRLVVYMGDDRTDGGVYKFVSELEYRKGRRSHNLRILEQGTLYVARWTPEGRRRFANEGDTVPLSATSGTGEWVAVTEEQLISCHERIIAAVGTDEWNARYATNRPEDLEVGRDGAVYIAFTNNAGVKDQHGAVRRLREDGDDPTATRFTWRDYAAGGPSGRADAGEQGFSSCDNLTFDRAGNLWVVTDISTSSLKGATAEKPYYRYHGNNAVFMIPCSGPNAGVAFRFANMPIEAEGTGPYFTPDERTLFVDVQHPGEDTPQRSGADPGNPDTFSSWWPGGNRTAGAGRKGRPRPSTVAITKLPPGGGGPPGSRTIPPTKDSAGPRVRVRGGSLRLSTFRRRGLRVALRLSEPATVDLTLTARLPVVRRRRRKARTSEALAARTREVTLARKRIAFTRAGERAVRLRPGAAIRLRLLPLVGRRLSARLTVVARDRAGNRTTVHDRLRLGR